jgi:phosphotriesterase-related protein
MTGLVTTVLGPVEAGELGVVLPHEHLYLDLYRVTRFRERLLNDVSLQTTEVGLFRAAGGGTIVDVTTPDLGRDPGALREISKATGVNVVMSTGRYREPWFEPAIWERSTADLAAEFVRDIEVGIDGIKAGVIGEIAVDGYHISPAEERVHRAAGRAAAATGVCITTHAIACPVGLSQLDLFMEEGVSPDRVAIGHADSYPVPEYHERIAQRGAYVQFDLIRGLHGYESEEAAQLRSIARLVSVGYGNRVLLSHDICDITKLAINGGPGYAYILTTFVGKLRAFGVDDDAIRRMLVDNPQRLLTPA